MIALDRSHADNGALNVLRASHKLGRLDHSRVVDHEGEGARSEMHADPEVPAALPPPVSVSGNAASKRLTSVAVVGTSGWS